MRIQHLVLDDDVHKALKGRKQASGVTVRSIGNAALRAALSLPTQEELIVANLIKAGKLEQEDYDQAVAAASRALRSVHAEIGREVVSTPNDRPLSVGSWQGRLIYRSEDGAFHMFLHRARDGRKLPSPLHHHEKSHTWAFVVRGRVLCRVGDEEVVLGPRRSMYVPPRVPHNSAPLTQTATMVMLMSPPEDVPRHRLRERRPKAKGTPRKSH